MWIFVLTSGRSIPVHTALHVPSEVDLVIDRREVPEHLISFRKA